MIYFQLNAHCSFVVYKKRCHACSTSKAYDGREHGIMNMGKFLIGYDVLRDYMYHFVLGNRFVLQCLHSFCYIMLNYSR